MYRHLFALAVALCISTTASAQSVTFSAKSLPYDVKTVSCDEIIAHTNTNKFTKMMAASLYVHGQHMGNRCIKPDYVRAFELFTEIGDTSSKRAALQRLQSRANSGNPLAKSQLKKLKKAGYIE